MTPAFTVAVHAIPTFFNVTARAVPRSTSALTCASVAFAPRTLAVITRELPDRFTVGVTVRPSPGNDIAAASSPPAGAPDALICTCPDFPLDSAMTGQPVLAACTRTVPSGPVTVTCAPIGAITDTRAFTAGTVIDRVLSPSNGVLAPCDHEPGTGACFGESSSVRTLRGDPTSATAFSGPRPRTLSTADRK